MNYGDACTGIGAATLAWMELGWKAQWFSQYDPEHNYEKGPDFPSKVLQHHYPHVPNLGDMLKIRNHKIYHDKELDLVVAGTPCQAFSIAGLRAGLRDERSNLALEFVRILIEKRPPWFVWENVPGVLTSGTDEQESEEGGGESEGSASDFACLLSAFTGRDIAAQDFEKAGVIQGEFYSIAWRVFDSQYFGVPQRRRRIFVVGYLGNDWRPPYAVLFESESLQRDFTPRREKRKNTAGGSKEGAGGSGSIGYRQRGFGDYIADDTDSALKKRDFKDATDLIVEKAIPINTMVAQGRPSDNGRMGSGVGNPDDPANTITKSHHHAVFYALKPAIDQPLINPIIYDTTQITSVTNGSSPQPGDPCHPLVKNGHPPLLVAQQVYSDNVGRGFRVHDGVTPPLLRNMGTGGGNVPFIQQTVPALAFKERSGKAGGGKGYMGAEETAYPVLANSNQNVFFKTLIRRLTPLECARLQGFPDNYLSDVPGAKDSNMYEAFGNSMTTFVMGHIGKRIDIVDKALKQVTT